MRTVFHLIFAKLSEIADVRDFYTRVMTTTLCYNYLTYTVSKTINKYKSFI